MKTLNLEELLEVDTVKHEITLITGDGIGPEIAEAMRRCVESTGIDVTWDVQTAGLDVFEAEGDPLPPRVIESIKRTGVGIKAPITTSIREFAFRFVDLKLP